MKSIREPVWKSIRKFYGQQAKLKIRIVIATRNILLNDVALAKCKEAQITIITDSEIDYYTSLVQHLKYAARYQFLAHMFGGQKIDGLARQVVATRGKMGGVPFYTFLIPPDKLLKIAYYRPRRVLLPCDETPGPRGLGSAPCARAGKTAAAARRS